MTFDGSPTDRRLSTGNQTLTLSNGFTLTGLTTLLSLLTSLAALPWLLARLPARELARLTLLATRLASPSLPGLRAGLITLRIALRVLPPPQSGDLIAQPR